MKFFRLTAILFAAVVAFASCKKGKGEPEPEPQPIPVKITDIALDQIEVNIASGGSCLLSVTEVLPSNASDTGVTWSSDPASVATVDQTGLVTVAGTAADGDKATITVTAKDGSGVKADCAVTVSGSLINGVVWAAYNVADAGKFASAPEISGMFYQWNRKTAWPTTGTVQDWDKTSSIGNTWEAVNDPCPSGWRVPTKSQQMLLLENEKVTSEWTTMNNVRGYMFTDKTLGTSIFLPVAGFRFPTAGELTRPDENGHYWLAESNSDGLAFNLSFSFADLKQNNYACAYGFSVRCVRQ